jgi:molybdopterin/thiamine biosynthesis adenylyltransferase
LGVEVAKNLILAGPKQVTIYDPNIVTIEDVGRNFYCREDHVGKISRAEASLSQLKDLNPNVQVSIAPECSIELMYLFHNQVHPTSTVSLCSTITTRII